MGRVVVTGYGAITPIGNSADEFWANAVAGKNGVERVTLVDPTPFDSQIGAEIKNFNPEDYMDKKDARRTDRVIQLAIVAAQMAMDHCGIELTEELRDNFGVLIGSGIGGLNTVSEQTKVLYERGAGRVSPFLIPHMISNMPAGMVSIIHGLRGPLGNSVTACATGATCIGDATEIIKRGDATMMLAGGTEASINDIGFSGFCAMRAMSTRNDDPHHASRPFDVDRDGFVCGEASCVWVLEDYDHAIARGATIYAEVAGYGLTADAHHLSAPHPDGNGVARCIQMGLRKAGISAEQVDYVNCHATSTGLGDKAETVAIKRALGEHAYKIPVSSTKSMIGHTFGAAGAVEGLACIYALNQGIVPPTINVFNQDPDCDLDVVPNVARKHNVKVAINNSFGFGGHNACLILTKPD